jgi:hypothetical protein
MDLKINITKDAAPEEFTFPDLEILEVTQIRNPLREAMVIREVPVEADTMK